ncbi:MAG TPA: hypothetical protein VKE73_10390 [Myxococcota bacterium]|nr:hypothetical protein [Myxococcota bacterium]
MIYLQQDFDLHPASPRTRDAFVALAQDALVAAAERHGARLIAAFFGNSERFFRVTHFFELPSLGAFEAWRAACRGDAAACDAANHAEVLAPRRRETLLEALDAIPGATLLRGIESARETPQGIYTAAHLKIATGRMVDFTKMLAAVGSQRPILASWRPVAGDPDLVIDLWKGDVEAGYARYAPADPHSDAFFLALRSVAPEERLVRYFPLPYSPLR